jgi:hypothetical protein
LASVGLDIFGFTGISGLPLRHSFMDLVCTSQGLLGCDVMGCCGRIRTFQRSMLPSTLKMAASIQKAGGIKQLFENCGILLLGI